MKSAKNAELDEKIHDFLNPEDLQNFGQNRWLPGYEKKGLLGQGTNSLVWLAEQKYNRRAVALKQCTKDVENRAQKNAFTEKDFH